MESIEKPIDDEFVGAIMLQGLIDDYESMVMALENSRAAVTSDFIKMKLLQDKNWQYGRHTVSYSALATRK